MTLWLHYERAEQYVWARLGPEHSLGGMGMGGVVMADSTKSPNDGVSGYQPRDNYFIRILLGLAWIPL